MPLMLSSGQCWLLLLLLTQLCFAQQRSLSNLAQALVMLHLTGSCNEIDMVLPCCHSCKTGQYSVGGPWKKQSCKHEDMKCNQDIAIWLHTGLAISTH